MNFARRRLRRGLTLDIAEAVPEPTPTSQPYLTNARLHIRPRKLEFNRRTQHFGRSVPSYQFQALFNSLFKVLCIFPSRYLFAIGLPPVFSFRWNLPPTLCFNPKKHDSSTLAQKARRTGVSPSQLPCSKGLGPANNARVSRPQFGAKSADSHGELHPFHSPLLRVSWLVSFPPLNYMLKFSGSSCLS